MAIPKIKEQDIIAALKFIDENGVPFHEELEFLIGFHQFD